MTAPVLTIVTVLASSRRMSPLERPTRLTMVEALFSAARPPDESSRSFRDARRGIRRSPRRDTRARAGLLASVFGSPSHRGTQGKHSCRSVCLSSDIRCSSHRHRCWRGYWRASQGTETGAPVGRGISAPAIAAATIEQPTTVKAVMRPLIPRKSSDIRRPRRRRCESGR